MGKKQGKRINITHDEIVGLSAARDILLKSLRTYTPNIDYELHVDTIEILRSIIRRANKKPRKEKPFTDRTGGPL